MMGKSEENGLKQLFDELFCFPNPHYNYGLYEERNSKIRFRLSQCQTRNPFLFHISLLHKFYLILDDMVYVGYF